MRASSVEEKKAWLAVLSNASMVRSFSSKNLEDLMGPADVELGTLRLADLHMGEVLGREQQTGGSGGSLEAPGPLFEPWASSYAPPYRSYSVF